MRIILFALILFMPMMSIANCISGGAIFVSFHRISDGKQLSEAEFHAAARKYWPHFASAAYKAAYFPTLRENIEQTAEHYQPMPAAAPLASEPSLQPLTAGNGYYQFIPATQATSVTSASDPQTQAQAEQKLVNTALKSLAKAWMIESLPGLGQMMQDIEQRLKPKLCYRYRTRVSACDRREIKSVMFWLDPTLSPCE